MTRFNESTLEEIALSWFADLGYEVRRGEEIAPGEPAAERGAYDQVVLVGRLRDAVERLNPEIPAEARDEAIRKVLHPESPSLVANNRKFHAMLRDRVEVEYRRRDGSIAGDRVRVRAEHFPETPPDVGLFSVNCGPLACIAVGESSPTIYVHQVLNHAETPVEVFNLICKHELLHLRIEPAREGKRLNQHPRAFWEAEKTIAPERRLAWCWIWENLGDCLRRRPRLERIDVQPRWPKVWSRQMCDLSFCRDLLRRTDKAFEPPNW